MSKTIKDVFEFPVMGYVLEYKLSTTTGEEDDIIAHALNHTESLAEALDDLLSSVSSAEHNTSAYKAALDALFAYRGEY